MRPALSSSPPTSPSPETSLEQRYRQLFSTYSAGEISKTSSSALKLARDSERLQFYAVAAKAYSVAGSCSLVELHLREALERYSEERRLAEKAANPALKMLSCYNIASVYNQLDDARAAYHYALAGLAVQGVSGEEKTNAGLRLQLASTLSKMHRFPEAAPIYRSAALSLEELNDFRAALIGWHMLGSDAMEAGQLALAETALTRALYITRMQKMPEAVSTLRKLARLRWLQGDARSAELLYQAAFASPTDTTPRWLLYADRGEFRISQHDYSLAFADFREARDLVRRMRADVVPNDQGRVNLENGLSRIADGFIEAGNHLEAGENAGASRETRIIETFEVAEQDRSMSLTALTPLPEDWRSRLPPEYWDLLSRYRSMERTAYSTEKATGPAEAKSPSDNLRMQISQMEAAAGSDHQAEQKSALQHVRSVLGNGDVFLSFHLGKRESWLWIVNGHEVKVVSLPAKTVLEAAVQSFRRSIREPSRAMGFEPEGRELYQTLFGKLPQCALRARRWVLELDGPLFDLPLAALVTPGVRRADGLPTYLGETIALQLAPAAPLLRRGRSMAGGSFVGVADPVYNGADPRYHGDIKRPPLTLPRLPSSRNEVTACAREYAPDRSTLLTGADANLPKLLETLKSTPTVLHFATHVISTPGEYRSGLIALGLDRAGDMELLGPMEIVARKVEAELVVLNGCQSGQAQTVPGSGLMGLTRAWIGSGANAVLATRWDVPDGDGQALVLAFYHAIREHPDDNLAFALQRARQALLQKDEARRKPSTWAAYFLFART